MNGCEPPPRYKREELLKLIVATPPVVVSGIEFPFGSLPEAWMSPAKIFEAFASSVTVLNPLVERESETEPICSLEFFGFKTGSDSAGNCRLPKLRFVSSETSVSLFASTSDSTFRLCGFQCAYVIETGDKFKSSARVTQGADKWLDVKKYKSTVDCVRDLKSLGYQVLATHLDANAKPIGEVDVTKPTAIVYGNERDGISKEMIELCDQTVIIPMQGFVQSFNISVAAAISLYHITRERELKLGLQGDLSEEEKAVLAAEFSLRSSKNPERLIEEILSRP